MQLIADLLANALDLVLQHTRLLAGLGLVGDHLADALQHRQRRLQAVRQVIQRIAVALALTTFAIQQAVE
ncbi:hypothetical protein D9M73_292540 [compost metagenome]